MRGENYNCICQIFLGKGEKHFPNFFASPDGRYLVFTGKSGYIYLLSSKVQCIHCSFSLTGKLKTNACTYVPKSVSEITFDMLYFLD